MDFSEYVWKISTYRPVELGDVEFEILKYFANGSSLSTYQLVKMLNKVTPAARTSTSYKNIHKRVKRLVQLQLIEQIKGPSRRRAKYYRVSTYGLISYAGRVITESDYHIKHNKKDIIIQCLLLQFFEEKTIDSPPSNYSSMKHICYYLHDCCSLTISICREYWNKIKQYNIEDILPPDEVIQKYMAHLDYNTVDQSILNEIEEYKKRLLRKYRKLKKEPPTSLMQLPFPLEGIHDNIVRPIQWQLETKIESLANTLVTRLGELVTLNEIKSKEEMDKILSKDYNYFLGQILKDKKFFELVRTVKEDFDIGFKQFSYYQ